MRHLAFVVAVVAAIAVNGCSGPSESPTGPSPASAPSTQVRSAAGPIDPTPLDASEDATLDVVDAPAAVNLSGIWRGTVKDKKGTLNVDFTLKHNGKIISGPLTNPTAPGMTVTLTLTEKSVSGTKRAYTGVLKISIKIDRCPSSTSLGTFVIDTTKKTLTGTVSGKNTDCINQTSTFNLKKV